MIRRLLEKSISTLFSLLIFAWLSIGIHEQFHYLMANALGIKGGNVTFLLGGGFYHFPEGVSITATQDALVGLAGGIGTGLALLVLWLVSNYQTRYTKWELDDSFALLVVAIMQFAYAPFDAFARQSAAFGAALAAILGLAFAVFIYGKTMWVWLNED